MAARGDIFVEVEEFGEFGQELGVAGFEVGFLQDFNADRQYA